MTSLFAHRGDHLQWPENSVGAVAAACENGADGVEIDVWLTSDNHLVVHHDRVVAGVDIPGSTRAQVLARTPVAHLGEVLEAAGHLAVNVEIKAIRSSPYDVSVARAVTAFLEEFDSAHRCLVSSFSLEICDEVRRLSPHRQVGWLAQRRPVTSVLRKVLSSGLTSAHLHFSRVNEAAAQRAADLGIELHVWTVNRERHIDRMLELGVAAIITDDVSLARARREQFGRARA